MSLPKNLSNHQSVSQRRVRTMSYELINICHRWKEGKSRCSYRIVIMVKVMVKVRTLRWEHLNGTPEGRVETFVVYFNDVSFTHPLLLYM